MSQTISHNRNDESLEAKARWFQALSLEERMDILCELTDLVLENNPQMAEVERAQSSSERIQVLSVDSGLAVHSSNTASAAASPLRTQSARPTPR